MGTKNTHYFFETLKQLLSNSVQSRETNGAENVRKISKRMRYTLCLLLLHNSDIVQGETESQHQEYVSICVAYKGTNETDRAIDGTVYNNRS